jgi:GTP-binding protein
LSPSAPGPSAKPDRPGRSPLAALPITFIGSYPDAAVALDPPLPEIAFVGRSNVGKSSLLNALVDRKGLARVSSTPGKTRLVNVFRLPTFYLVDLPGYGYAKASKGERAGFKLLLEAYLTGRPNLAGVVWLLDIRHAPSDQDYEVQEALILTERPVLVVLTKGDKLPRGQRAAAYAGRARDLGLAPDELLLTSATSGEGIAELAKSVLAAAT